LEAKLRIEEEYPNTKQLFHCIFASGNQGRKGVILDTQKISTSSDLEGISQIFTRMSEALRGLSKTKASALLKIIQDKRIYPIRRKAEPGSASIPKSLVPYRYRIILVSTIRINTKSI
jgi:hypothetical protein